MRLLLIAVVSITSLFYLGPQVEAVEHCSWEESDLDPDSSRLSNSDLQRCRAFILERALEDDVSAIILKSRLALQGIGERKSRRNARLLLEAASAQGAPIAKRLLADLLVSRLGAKVGDYIKAENLYIEAARAGDTKSDSNLAQLYANGNVPGKSTVDAEVIYQKHIGDDAISKLRYAKILLSRQTEPDKLRKASDLLFEAAKMGSSEASFLFAVLNINNAGLTGMSAMELQDLLCASAEEGYTPAKYECAKFLIEKHKDLSKSLRYLREAAEDNDADSITYLATYYSDTGEVSDLRLAKKLWFRAATLGSDAAKMELIYRFDALTHSEQLNVNGAFIDPDGFSTDIGRILLGNHNLSVVARGQSGEYIEGEYLHYRDALRAFSIVAKSENKSLALQAREIADELEAQKESYEYNLKARREERDSRLRAEFWGRVLVVSVAILSLSGASNDGGNISEPKNDSCAGINGGAWFGMSATAIAFSGCNPYSF